MTWRLEYNVIVISSDDDDTEITIKKEKTVTAGSSNENSPSMLSSEDPLYYPLTKVSREQKFEYGRPARLCKLEPTECSSAQYMECTYPATSVDANGYQTPREVVKASMNGNTTSDDEAENSTRGPQSEPQSETEINGKTTMPNNSTSPNGVVKSPVKKLRKRKLLASPDGPQLPPVKRNRSAVMEGEVSKKRRFEDNFTAVGSRIIDPSATLKSISQSTPVSVIRNVGEKVPDTTLADVARATGRDQAQSNVLSTSESFLPRDDLDDDLVDLPTSSTPARPQHNKPVPDFCSPSDNFTSVKEEPSHGTSVCSTVRRKRKLCKSQDLDTDIEKTDGTTFHNDVKLPTFLDSNIIISHTKQNSRTQLCFTMQLQAQGFALPHAYILELVQEMMMANSPSYRNTIYNILLSDSERFPQALNKDFLNQLFTTIIDSLMTRKYHHTDNASMALNYILNIFCMNWRNSVVESSSYIATFLSTKTRQLLCEIRKYYERPAHLFSSHIASMLQQLMCLPLAVVHEPQRLSEFSHSLFNEVFVELSRDKQKVFLNNLSSPYLTTQLIATQLTNNYVPLESRDLLLSNHLYSIDSNWINTLLMLVSPYLSDGREDLVHLIWLMTQLLAKFVQRQKGGVVLCTPICVTNPLLTIDSDTLLNCTSLMEEFMDRLKEDEILCNTCLFTPEVCYHMKLMLALTEEKTTLNFDGWL